MGTHSRYQSSSPSIRSNPDPTTVPDVVVPYGIRAGPVTVHPNIAFIKGGLATSVATDSLIVPSSVTLTIDRHWPVHLMFPLQLADPFPWACVPTRADIPDDRRLYEVNFGPGVSLMN